MGNRAHAIASCLRAGRIPSGLDMDTHDDLESSCLSQCRAPHCQRAARTAGYCPRHYQQLRRHGRLTPEREYQVRGSSCGVPHCGKPQIAKGVCFRHYQQIRRYGRLTPERERVYGRTGCRVPGCPDPHSSRGYCKRHYMSEFYLPRKHASASQSDLNRAAA